MIRRILPVAWRLLVVAAIVGGCVAAVIHLEHDDRTGGAQVSR